MAHRSSALRFLPLLLLTLAAAACEGPVGPEGPEGPQGQPGPGTRLVRSGTIIAAPDSTGFASETLPAAAGTLANPPSVTCWLSPDNQFWFTDFCYMDQSGNALTIYVVGLNGWRYRIVVVY